MLCPTCSRHALLTGLCHKWDVYSPRVREAEGYDGNITSICIIRNKSPDARMVKVLEVAVKKNQRAPGILQNTALTNFDRARKKGREHDKKAGREARAPKISVTVPNCTRQLCASKRRQAKKVKFEQRSVKIKLKMMIVTDSLGNMSSEEERRG